MKIEVYFKDASVRLPPTSDRRRVLAIRYTKKSKVIRDLHLFVSPTEFRKDAKQQQEMSNQSYPYWTHWCWFNELIIEYAGESFRNA